MEFAHGRLAEVASTGLPLIIGLDEHRSHKTDHGIAIREDAHHIGTPFDLAVQPFQRIGGVDARPVLWGEVHEREHLIFPNKQHLRCRKSAALHSFRYRGQLSMGGLGAGLRGKWCRGPRPP